MATKTDTTRKTIILKRDPDGMVSEHIVINDDARRALYRIKSRTGISVRRLCSEIICQAESLIAFDDGTE